MHQSPQNRGFLIARWTLAALRQTCQSLQHYSLGGVCQILHRLGLQRKQGQSHYVSPDPDYQIKLALIQARLKEVQTSPNRQALLYGDETTFFRQPSLAKIWYPQGTLNKPRAEYAYVENTQSRVMAGLNPLNGEVVALQAPQANIAALCQFLHRVRKAYSSAEPLYLVWDNWPVHKLPRVVQAAEENHIDLLWLPTYAPWLNPIEKLWKWLKQTVIHMHRWSQDWEWLKQQVSAFLQRFEHGSQELLHYVGLLPY